MNFPAISQVDAYWESLRDGRLMPKRSEVDPRGLEGALEYAMLMELVAPGVARVRVSGMHMQDLMGMEVRGMPLTAFFDPEDRARLSQLINEVVQSPKVAELALTSAPAMGRPQISARMYLAPLQADVDERARMIGCLQSKGGIGRTPRRFKIEEIHTRRIVAAATKNAKVPEERKPRIKVEKVRQDLRQFAEPRALFAPERPLSKSERPHLRLVKTDT